MKKLLFYSLLLFVFIPNIFGQSSPKIRQKNTPLTLKQGDFKGNSEFVKGQKYYSADNRYFLIFQEDGNLVIYKVQGNKSIWNTHTNGKAVKKCIFQSDGNLVLYDFTGKAVWDSLSDKTQKDEKKKNIFSGDTFIAYVKDSWISMQTDGNLVIYNSEYPNTNNPFWDAGCYEKN